MIMMGVGNLWWYFYEINLAGVVIMTDNYFKF